MKEVPKTEGDAMVQAETREVGVLDGLGSFESNEGSSANKRKIEEEPDVKGVLKVSPSRRLSDSDDGDFPCARETSVPNKL